MEADVNELFSKKFFDMLSTLTNKVSIKEENYMGNIKTSKDKITDFEDE